MFIRHLSPESPISTVSVLPKISFVSCVPTQSPSPTSSSKGLSVLLSCLRWVLSAPQLFLSWLHPMLLIHFGLSRPQVALSQRIPSPSLAIKPRASPQPSDPVVYLGATLPQLHHGLPSVRLRRAPSSFGPNLIPLSSCLHLGLPSQRLCLDPSPL